PDHREARPLPTRAPSALHARRRVRWHVHRRPGRPVGGVGDHRLDRDRSDRGAAGVTGTTTVTPIDLRYPPADNPFPEGVDAMVEQMALHEPRLNQLGHAHA